MISKKEFINRIENMPKKIYSKTKQASYTSFALKGDTLKFKRVNTNKDWALNVEVLFKVYLGHNFINTAVIKKATNGKVNSPSVAVLMQIGCIDNLGQKIN